MKQINMQMWQDSIVLNGCMRFGFRAPKSIQFWAHSSPLWTIILIHADQRDLDHLNCTITCLYYRKVTSNTEPMLLLLVLWPSGCCHILTIQITGLCWNMVLRIFPQTTQSLNKAHGEKLTYTITLKGWSRHLWVEVVYQWVSKHVIRPSNWWK